MPDGRTVVCKKPVFKDRRLSQEQKGRQDRLKLALASAREAKAQRIERSEERVRVMAGDDVMVASVFAVYS